MSLSMKSTLTEFQATTDSWRALPVEEHDEMVKASIAFWDTFKKIEKENKNGGGYAMCDFATCGSLCS